MRSQEGVVHKQGKVRLTDGGVPGVVAHDARRALALLPVEAKAREETGQQVAGDRASHFAGGREGAERLEEKNLVGHMLAYGQGWC